MKAFSKILSVLLAAILFVSISTGCAEQEPEDRLSPAQIAELREQYPICGKKIPAYVDMYKMPFEHWHKRIETYVYGEIAGELSKYSRGGFVHYEYPVSVISDTEGKYSEGDMITISGSMELVEYNPQFSEGMKLVVGVVADEGKDGKEGRTSYSAETTYYITEDGYALSAYDESEEKEKYQFSGIRVEALLKKLKKGLFK